MITKFNIYFIFKTAKWLSYGKEALSEYKLTNIKSPVCSIDWLLFKNNYYKNDIILSEKSVKIINSYIQESIDNEFNARENIEQFCDLNKITKSIQSLESKWFVNCQQCIELNYLSYAECSECKKKYCISHLYPCKCSAKNIVLYYRHKNDLYYYSKNKKAINAINRANAINSFPNSNNLDKNSLIHSLNDNLNGNKNYYEKNNIQESNNKDLSSVNRKAYSDDSINKDGQSEE